MTHLTLHPVVRVSVTSGDGQLLDDVASAIPSKDTDTVASEYTVSRRDATDGDGRRLTARVSFTTDTDGETAASDVYDALTVLSLPSDATVVHYQSPLGAVRASEVTAWYQNHPDKCPTDDDGETFVPTAWDPSRHTISRR